MCHCATFYTYIIFYGLFFALPELSLSEMELNISQSGPILGTVAAFSCFLSNPSFLVTRFPSHDLFLNFWRIDPDWPDLEWRAMNRRKARAAWIPLLSCPQVDSLPLCNRWQTLSYNWNHTDEDIFFWNWQDLTVLFLIKYPINDRGLGSGRTSPASVECVLSFLANLPRTFHWLLLVQWTIISKGAGGSHPS